MLLSEYMPKSELRVEEHIITKPLFPAIDCHTHFGVLGLGDDYEKLYDTGEVVGKMKGYGLAGVINLDGGWGEELDRMLVKTKGFEDFILTFGSVDVSKLEEPGFEKDVERILTESKEKGIRGLKFWKNIGLALKDSKGRYISADDDRLTVIWQTAARLKLPVLIHIADPIAFFKPVDRFNERYEELQEHPDWSFCDPGLYGFDELMEMQQNLLRKNSNTTFIIAHMGSCAEHLNFVSSCLEQFPNMYVDIAARIAELGRQPYTARKFFIKHQDRILFGSDATALSMEYLPSYRFLETWDEYFDYSGSDIPLQGRWKIYGLGLQPDILEKVYYKNVRKVLGI